MADPSPVNEARPDVLDVERQLLREVAASGIAWSHPAIDYVEVQIDVQTWQKLQEVVDLSRAADPATYTEVERLDRPGNRANLSRAADPEPPSPPFSGPGRIER